MGMSDLNERLNQLEQGALNFLFPRRCPFCNQHIGNKELICADCEKKLPYTGDRAVRQTSWGRVAAPLYYEDAVRRAILDFKFKGRMGGLPCFGSLTARLRRRFRLTGTQVMASNSPPNSSAAQRAVRLPKQGRPPMRPLNLKSRMARRTASS